WKAWIARAKHDYDMAIFEIIERGLERRSIARPEPCKPTSRLRRPARPSSRLMAVHPLKSHSRARGRPARLRVSVNCTVSAANHGCPSCVRCSHSRMALRTDGLRGRGFEAPGGRLRERAGPG